MTDLTPGNSNFIATLSQSELAQVNAIIGGRDIYDAVLPNINWGKFGEPGSDKFLNLNYTHPSFASVHIGDSDFGPNSLGKNEIRLTRSGQQIFSYVADDLTLEAGVRFDSPPSVTGLTELRFRIACSPGLSWFPQGELSQADIDDGAIRPANVVGSIAVYAGMGNVSHGVWGPRKVAHLFRWSVKSKSGLWAWCDALLIDGEFLLIRLPVDWLNALPMSEYPVQAMGHRVDTGSTFGASGSGATEYLVAINRQFASPMGAAPEDGTADSISAYVKPQSANFTFGIFSESGGLPATNLRDTGGGNPAGGTSKTYITQNLDSGLAITSGPNYWVGSNRDATSSWYYDSTPGTDSKWESHSYADGALSDYGGFPSDATDKILAFYINYTPAGGAGSETASGTLAAQSSTVSGSAKKTGKGSGTLQAQNSAIIAAAIRIITAAGTPASQSSTASGAATRTITGSGTPQSQDSTAAGSATREIAGSGSLGTGSSAASGTAERKVTASGAPATGNASTAGVAERIVTASGALASGDSTVSGSTTAGNTVTASGGLQAQSATASGTANREVTSSGNPASQAATATGVALRVIKGSGNPSAQSSSITAAALRIIKGTGGLQSQDAQVNGQTSETVTPASRIHRILAEDRTMLVDSENRNFIIKAENRQLTA